MLVGAGRGALVMIAGGAQSGHLAGFALGVALAPVGALFGGVYGAVKTRSTEEVDAAAKTLNAVITRNKPHQMIRERVVARAKKNTNRKVTTYYEQANAPDYVALAQQGYKSVLVINVDHYGFKSNGRFDPDLRLTLAVTGRVLQLPSGQQLFSYRWKYIGRKRNYFALAKKAGDNLQAELETAADHIATRIVYVFFQAPPYAAPRGRNSSPRRAPPALVRPG